MTDSIGQAAVDRAFDEKNLVLVYQPIHHARSQAVVAVEALLRQRRESGEIREAGIITATAEETSDLYALDSWTMRTAFNDASRWQSHIAPNVRLNVNLSPREFEQGAVAEHLRAIVRGCGIDLHRVNLEITETSYIAHPKETRQVLEELKSEGLQLWLDDFGSGHSSLEHLHLFPVDGLKIPAVFIKHLVADRRSQAITRNLIALAHDLDIKVIAEGIEHETQLHILQELDCDLIQGFLLSRPMLIPELEGMLKAGRKEQ